MVCSWYEIDLGSRLGSIDGMCKEAIEIAKLLNTQCTFNFNGVKVCVDKNSKWERVVEATLRARSEGSLYVSRHL